jgi:hypothetical protein
MTSREFQEKNIFNEKHPLHGDFIKEVKRYEDEKERLRQQGVRLPGGDNDLSYLLGDS